MDNRLKMSLQCILVEKVANSILGCTRQSFSSRSREVMLLLYSAQARHAWSAVPCPWLPSTGDADILE